MWVVNAIFGAFRQATPAVSRATAGIVRRYSSHAVEAAKAEMPSTPPESVCVPCAEAAAKPWKGPANYSSVPTPPGPSTKPTPAQKRAMMEANRRHNAGMLRDDTSGEEMVPAKKSAKGVTPPRNEVQVDHIVPESRGGTRDSDNLQLMTRANNRDKWDKMPDDPSS